ncbi:MAG: hypothetical protein NTW27_04045 [Deltaproteobacteria bacterium]|nr:hypothetical protein [Deltaproteobacteria bacterium]
MTKNVDRNEAEKSLRNKGFRLEKDHDHIFYYHEYRGRETGIKTKFSHSKKMKDIGGEILSSMKKQLRLNTLDEIVRFLECPMSEDEYLAVLKASRFPGLDDID